MRRKGKGSGGRGRREGVNKYTIVLVKKLKSKRKKQE